ncbi:MAG: GAF domain-containing protein [Hyphomicrobiaceae bacterium]|nr:GAF domain-containing protein [Hyphomicrobiaceae bacterium]
MSPDVDLTSCDKEPIHTPGSIQPHGCLVACDDNMEVITRISTNAPDMLGLGGAVIGQRLSEYLGSHAAHALRNASSQSSDPKRPALLLAWKLAASGRMFDVSVHRHAGAAIIEFEPVSPGARPDPTTLIREIIARTRGLPTIEQLAVQVPRYLRAILGYDRVMIYRFDPDGSGKVIGEAKRSNLERFLGQHFPASDIPQQARTLYLENTIRIISSAAGDAYPLSPSDRDSARPLDLTYAHLRSVSPIHLEYLRNMGVGASMSLSIVVEGKLWGLIACHHYAPRVMSMPLRVAAEVFADFFSLHLTSTHHHRRFETFKKARQALDDLNKSKSPDEPVDLFLRRRLGQIQELLPCDGVGLWIGGIWTSAGATPPPSAIPAIATLLTSQGGSEVFQTDNLSVSNPAAASYANEAAGMLAIPLSQAPRDYLLFFRKEQIRTVEWAGDPQKQYEVGPLGERLTPRKSFAIWRQLVERQSHPWSADDLATASAIQVRLRDVLLEQSEQLSAERRKSDARQQVLNEELNHRVKNILALIKSLVNRPVESSESVAAYANSLKGRIMALAFAHDQIVRSDGGGSLRTLLQAELSPYPESQVEITGSDINLDARAYSVMALVIHELATNAAKYGALSQPSGRLRIGSSLNDAGDCQLVWSEEGGPPVRAPDSRGFGSVLLTRSIPFDLGGMSEVDYARDGVKARLVVPAKFLSKPTAPDDVKTKLAIRPARVPLDLGAARILVVEDQLVIALDAEEMLSCLGARTVSTVATSADALHLIAEQRPDIAILDINLGYGTSLPVADELAKLGVPFAFATGYGDSAMVPDRMKKVPMLRKPFTSDDLRDVLYSMLQ